MKKVGRKKKEFFILLKLKVTHANKFFKNIF